MSEQALEMARALIQRDGETPQDVRRIEVGRGGLILLAQALLEADQRERKLREALEEQVAWFQAHPGHACGVPANLAREALRSLDSEGEA